jgi:CHAT domain-containing protein/Tfp pilus assembly protein PilF
MAHMQTFCDNMVTVALEPALKKLKTGPRHPKSVKGSAAIVLLILAVTVLSNPRSRSEPQPQQNSTIAAAEQAFVQGQTLLGEGTAISQREAIERFTEAARLWHTLGDQRKEAIALSFIGKVYDLLGEKQNALDFYTQTLGLVRAAGDRTSEAATLNNIGLIYDSLGEKQKALDYYNNALPILEAIGNTRVQAITLVNIGLVFDSIGEKQTALQFYQQALPLLRAAHDSSAEAVALNNIGYLYDSIGDREKALTYFGQALPILREVGNRRIEAITLNNIGYVYDSLGEKQKALDYYGRALPVLHSVGDRRMEAITLNNIGLIRKALGEQQKAFEFFQQALDLRRVVNDRPGEGVTLSDIGSVYALLGEDQKALDFYQQSLELSRAGQDRSTEAETLRRIALTKVRQGQFEEARRAMENGLGIVEHLRTRIAGQELRASYFASIQQFFGSYIDILMRLHHDSPAKGYDAIALHVAERAHARSLLDSLSEAHANIREGIAPALLERERVLQRNLDIAAEREARLISANASSQDVAVLKTETEVLLREYQEVETQIRASSPRYAALTQPLPLKVNEIQEQVVDTDSVLLEYALGDEKSYLWAVTTSSVQSFELPSRKTIETATRNVYDLLTQRNKHIKFEKAGEQSARIAKADAEYVSAASSLSQILLGPAASQIAKKRLLIVGDGALSYLPFAALPEPGTRSKVPLIVAHDIVNLPSASTLAVLRSELMGRAAAPKTVAVIADPVFQKDDERVIGTRPRARKNRPNNRSIGGKSILNLAKSDVSSSPTQSETDEVTEIHRLPFTRREADQILSLVPETDRFKAVDFDANRLTATNSKLGQYRYVHFATHGFLNTAHPELSGIVLSLVDRKGTNQDGFLWAHEVYNLRLPVEMVVLSGCRTGLGKEIKGEGLVSLTRGFMYAGSKRVIVSLWDISDEASAKLMARLYRAILKEHMSPTAALRIAQLEVMKDSRWQSPYYWAAFVLQGEPN